MKKKIITFVAVLLASILAAFFFTNGRLFSTPRFFLVGTAWSLSIWLTQSYGNAFIIRLLDRKFSWLEKPKVRFVLSLLAISLYSFVAFVFVDGLFNFLVSGKFGYINESGGIAVEALYKSGRIAVTISLVISFVLTGVGFLRAWRNAAVDAERLQKEVYRHRYESLRNQVNPHFLFNSLNVLTELVHEDPNVAVRFIRQLSDVYRYVLESRDRDVVSVDDELKFAESYLYLLEMRFGEKLKVQIFRASGTDGWLVPMSLQLLLENVAKHNAISSSQPIDVRIRVDHDQISVTNTVVKRTAQEESTGVGLNYLSERYASLGGEMIVSNGSNTFEVILPILKSEM